MNVCRTLMSSQPPDVVNPSTSPVDNISGTPCQLQKSAEVITQFLGVSPGKHNHKNSVLTINSSDICARRKVFMHVMFAVERTESHLHKRIAQVENTLNTKNKV